jgi:two-component system heavy metal sensor histidine kinase CusS
MRRSLAARLSLLFGLISFTVLASVGTVLYKELERQLVQRDDAALITRVDHIRTLLNDMDLVDMIHRKPQLFSNMLGNREALLVLRFSGREPLIEVNPRQMGIPAVTPVQPGATLTLDAVHHKRERRGIPFAFVAASMKIPGAEQDLQIIAGRLMGDRSRMLESYRYQMMLVVCMGTSMLAVLAWWVAKRGLGPLHKLAEQTSGIGIRNLCTRINAEAAPHELLPLIYGFNAMLDRLHRSFTQLSQVSADMAHDLRTPISNILGQTEVALGQERDIQYYQNLLGSNFEELQRLSKMTDNMLFLACAENADSAIERKVLSLDQELRRMTDYFEGIAEERGVRLEVSVSGEIWADPTLLRRALANLLANAVRHAEKASDIVVAAKRENSGTSISVQNCGTAIASVDLERLFDRFYRVDPARTDSSTSSGLGLSIVRSVMMLHQGKWRATSNNGYTEFAIWFPDKPPERNWN